MIAIIAFVLSVLTSLFPLKGEAQLFTVVTTHEEMNTIKETCGETVCNCYELNCGIDCGCWVCFEDEAYGDAQDEFTRLFNSYEYKLAKNGRSMIRRSGEKSFKFAPKGK